MAEHPEEITLPHNAITAEGWKVHTPNLLREVLSNNDTQTLRMPLNIFSNLLAEVAERAAKVDDPALNILMLRLTLYDQADPEKHAQSAIEVAYAQEGSRLRAKATGAE